jgi:hypothetical protein
MGPEVLLTHSSVKNLSTVQPRDKGLEEGAERCSTPNIKLIFDLLGRCDGLFQRKWANANLFETLNEEDEGFGFLRKALKALEGGWTFKGNKKHKVKIELALPATDHLPHLNVLLGKTLGKKKVRNIQNSTIPFFIH